MQDRIDKTDWSLANYENCLLCIVSCILPYHIIVVFRNRHILPISLLFDYFLVISLVDTGLRYLQHFHKQKSLFFFFFILKQYIVCLSQHQDLCTLFCHTILRTHNNLEFLMALMVFFGFLFVFLYVKPCANEKNTYSILH